MRKYRYGKEIYIFDNLTNIGVYPGDKDEFSIYCDTVKIEYFKDNLWSVETSEDGQTTAVMTLEATFNEISHNAEKIKFSDYTICLYEKVF